MIAIDVGYSDTKACSLSGHRISIPSVVAPLAADPLGGVLGNGVGYKVHIRRLTGTTEEKLIGEAAAASFFGTSFLGKDKPADMHDLLVLTAAYLVGAGGTGMMPGQVDLAVGLPLAYYKTQRDALKARLAGLSAWVRVNGGEERYISFGNVLVAPQGAAAVFAFENLTKAGYVVVVDIGRGTTDYVLLFITDGVPRPVAEASGSLEIGCHLVLKALAHEFQAKTGAPLPQRMERQVLARVREGEPVSFGGKKIDLSDAFRKATVETSRAISRQVLSALGDFANFVEAVYLIGGGPLLLGSELTKAFPTATIASDPVFANANGYLKMLSKNVYSGKAVVARSNSMTKGNL